METCDSENAVRPWSRAQLLASLGALSLIWGTQFLIIRLGQHAVPALITAAARFAIVGVVAQLIIMLHRSRAPRGLGVERLLFGGAQALAIGFLYFSERHVPSSLAGIVFGTCPFFVILLAHCFVPGERMRLALVAAALLGFGGLGLLTAGAHGASATGVVGCLAALGAAAATAVNKVTAKRIVSAVPTPVLLRDMAVVTAVVTAAGSAVLERDQAVEWTTGAIFAVGYLAVIASLCASTLYLAVLRRTPVSSLAYLQFVSAFVAVLTGVLVGREEFGSLQALGSTLILTGLVLLARQPHGHL